MSCGLLMVLFKRQPSSFACVSLQINAIGLPYEGHQPADKTLLYFSKTCWFSGIRKDFVASCHPCKAGFHIQNLFPCNPITCLTSLGTKYLLISKGLFGENTIYIFLSTKILNFLRLICYPQQLLRNLGPY